MSSPNPYKPASYRGAIVVMRPASRIRPGPGRTRRTFSPAQRQLELGRFGGASRRLLARWPFRMEELDVNAPTVIGLEQRQIIHEGHSQIVVAHSGYCSSSSDV